MEVIYTLTFNGRTPNMFQNIETQWDWQVDASGASTDLDVSTGNGFARGQIVWGATGLETGSFADGFSESLPAGFNLQGILLSTGYQISNSVRLEAGYNYLEAHGDDQKLHGEDVSHVYFRSRVNLAPGIYVVPEIGRVNETEDRQGIRQEKITYCGAKWEINF